MLYIQIFAMQSKFIYSIKIMIHCEENYNTYLSKHACDVMLSLKMFVTI